MATLKRRTIDGSAGVEGGARMASFLLAIGTLVKVKNWVTISVYAYAAVPSLWTKDENGNVVFRWKL